MTAYHTTQHYANYYPERSQHYPCAATATVTSNPEPIAYQPIIQSNCQYQPTASLAYYPMQNHYYPYHPYTQAQQQSEISTERCTSIIAPNLKLSSTDHIGLKYNNNIERDISGNNIMFDRYAVLKRIGEGTFGDIWKVFDMKCATKCALKTLKCDKTWNNGTVQRLRQIFINEGQRIAALNNIDTDEAGKQYIIQCKQIICSNIANNVVNQMNYNQSVVEPYIILELWGHSLLKYMKYHEQNRVKIPLHRIRRISSQIMSAMSFMHGVGECMHCDLKPENILINSGTFDSIKIIDFGNTMSFNKKMSSFDVQTLWYRAPEVLFGNFNEISSLMDIWSVGCILFELLYVNMGKYMRLFRSDKFDASNVVYKIYNVLDGFPQYMFNQYKSYHFNKDMAIYHHEASYIKLKAIRVNKLWFNLVNTNVDMQSQKEFMCFVDLLSGLLDPNALTRYTSEDAMKHPFIAMQRQGEDLMKRVHPIIKSSNDNERQQRINQQIAEYQLLCHRYPLLVMNTERFPTTITKQCLY